MASKERVWGVSEHWVCSKERDTVHLRNAQHRPVSRRKTKGERRQPVCAAVDLVRSKQYVYPPRCVTRCFCISLLRCVLFMHSPSHLSLPPLFHRWLSSKTDAGIQLEYKKHTKAKACACAVQLGTVCHWSDELCIVSTCSFDNAFRDASFVKVFYLNAFYDGGDERPLVGCLSSYLCCSSTIMSSSSQSYSQPAIFHTIPTPQLSVLAKYLRPFF